MTADALEWLLRALFAAPVSFIKMYSLYENRSITIVNLLKSLTSIKKIGRIYCLFSFYPEILWKRIGEVFF